MQIVDNLNAADAVMTIKNYYRQQPAPILEAERRNIPIYILRSNTVMQMEQCLVDIFHVPSDAWMCFKQRPSAKRKKASHRVLNGASDDIELTAVGQHSQTSSTNWRAPPTSSAIAMAASPTGGWRIFRK